MTFKNHLFLLFAPTSIRVLQVVRQGLGRPLRWLRQELKDRTIEPTEKEVDDLIALVEGLPNRYFDVLFGAKIVGVTLENDELTESLNDCYESHAFNVTQLHLYMGLVSKICALVADDDGRTGSLRRILKRLDNDGLRKKILERQIADFEARDRYQGVDDKIAHKWREEDIERIETDFHRLWDSIQRRRGVVGHDLVRRMLHARHKSIAHHEVRAGDKESSGVYDIGEFGLQWGDPAKYLEEIEELVFNLVLLVTQASYDPSDFTRMNHVYSLAMWERLRLGPRQDYYELEQSLEGG